jgi:MOSC domain-containing protein YiiM
MGVIEEIYIAARGGEPMIKVEEVQAVAGAGLRGDRYMERTGYWTAVDECEVTLIRAEDLEQIIEKTGVRVAGGEHRRNLVTRGIDLYSLRGKRFTAGGATLEFDRPRPPCRYIQSLTERGMTKALGRNRGGICARVVESGLIRPGDALKHNLGA